MTEPESITVSLEWAKKLKEAGWSQEKSCFWWSTMLGGQSEVCTDWEKHNLQTLRYVQTHIAAPTAEEILRRLPVQLDDTGKRWLTIAPNAGGNNGWWMAYCDMGIGEEISIKSHTLADTASAMYCYLAENKLLPSPKYD